MGCDRSPPPSVRPGAFSCRERPSQPEPTAPATEPQMDPTFFTRGFVIGFTVAMAVGPMSVLTMRRTIAHGRLYGLVSGLGIATADASYGALAAFGLTAITAALVGARTALGLAGGVFLVWLAIRTLRARPAPGAAAAEDRPGLPGAYLSTYGL